jgi:hypothetical protein
MSGKDAVNVLGVMRTNADRAELWREAHLFDETALEKWRARSDAAEKAVAELVAAVKEYRAALQAFANDGSPASLIRHEQADERLTAALANIGATP